MWVKETKQRSGWKSVSEHFMGGQTGGPSTEVKRPDVFPPVRLMRGFVQTHLAARLLYEL
jgi:hypothetical protein